MGDRIMPRTFIGSISVGGMKKDQAAERLQQAIDVLRANGIRLTIEGVSEVVLPDSVGFDMNLSEAVDMAFKFGHDGGLFSRIGQRVASLWSSYHDSAPVRINESALLGRIAEIANVPDLSLRDIRLQVVGTRVTLLTDTKPGIVVNQEVAFADVVEAFGALDSATIDLQFHIDIPKVDQKSGSEAVRKAQKLISRSLSLQYEDMQFFITRTRVGSWIISRYEENKLVPDLDREAVSAYAATIARMVNVSAQPPQVMTSEGKVTGFTIPKVGRTVQEEELMQTIIDKVMARIVDDKAGDSIIIPVKSTKMAVIGLDESVGITELVGKATTPFTGSPKNRILNIKNGIKFLSGIIVQPGQEFSTLSALEPIDDTNGYLPELVIKGTRTVPEFGGGLCQVSTTLFRAVLNTGLPVTARRNHSYRVSYYEKDGAGNYIGPGLDATIYEPNVDFRFRNDMQTPILIIGYVIGDKATFELYGTKDGRTSTIIGPTLLTQTLPGDPIYIDAPELAVGVTKQVETPHPGGSAIATYAITYPDGRVESQTFSSYYRRWPAQYLVGTGGVIPSPLPTP